MLSDPTREGSPETASPLARPEPPETASPLARPESPETADPPPAKPGPLVLAGLVCGPFVSMVDSNAVNVAVPEIGREMYASLSTVGWIVSAYMLGIGVCLPATAWLARRVGTRRLYMAALVAFALSSAACGLAPGIEALIGLRAVQGIASAPLIPLALTLLFGGERTRGARPPMVAGLLFFLAPALGPTIGGLLIATGGWRLIFLINVPLIAIGLLGIRRLPATRPGPSRTVPRSIWPGCSSSASAPRRRSTVRRSSREAAPTCGGGG